MNSRMDKYYKEDINSESRTNKNKDIYKEIDVNDLEDLELTTNISIIDTDTSNLDIKKLKEYLDNKYVKNKSVHEEIEEELNEDNIDLEDTKEYDLKKVIKDAQDNNVSDYDTDRFRKIRETQYDILKNLDLDRTSEPEKTEVLSLEETAVMNLINTVETPSNVDNEDDDLLSSLKGDDGTEVLGKMSDTISSDLNQTLDNKPTIVEELEKTIKLSREDIDDKLAEDNNNTSITDDSESKKETKDDLVNTFFTGKYQILDGDFDSEGFNDLKKEMKSKNIFIKSIVFIFVVALIIGIVYFLDIYFKLGLFK